MRLHAIRQPLSVGSDDVESESDCGLAGRCRNDPGDALLLLYEILWIVEGYGYGVELSIYDDVGVEVHAPMRAVLGAKIGDGEGALVHAPTATAEPKIIDFRIDHVAIFGGRLANQYPALGAGTGIG